MTGLTQIQELCEPLLTALGPEYSKRYNEELKDLKKWDIFLQKDKASEILSMKDKMLPSNKSGSVILFLIKASSVDPIKENISIQQKKFGKADPPDIDTDLHPDIRDDIKQFLVNKFGKEHVCSVGTVGTYKTKNVILDVVRALGLDVKEANEVTKGLDLEVGEGDDEKKLDKAGFDEICGSQPELAAYFENHPDVRRHAEILRNQAKNLGTHAGGMIVSNVNVLDTIPVFKDKEDRVVSCWAESGEFQELSSIGLVKMDLLGLRHLKILTDCLKNIFSNKGKTLSRSQIPIDDHESIRLGTRGELLGIFQFENPYTKKVADRVGCDSLADIAAITSLIRPGPKDVGLDMEYAERKNGKKYDRNPVFDKVLSGTHGVLTYQEQVQLLGITMAGLTPLEANRLRKGASKKKKEIMDEMKPKFIHGSIDKCVKTGIMTEEQALKTWDMIESTASYSFNKSHAVAYSAVTTAELWLRKNFFCEYMTALIESEDPAKEKFGATIFDKYVKFAIGNGLIVHKPDINESRAEFRLVGQDAYFGFSHVKNVSSASSAIVRNQPYKDFDDFYTRCTTPFGTDGRMRKLNSRVVESLIYAGTFDRWGSKEEIMKKLFLLSDRIESNKLPRITSDIRDYIPFHENEISLDYGDLETSGISDFKIVKKVKALGDDDSLFEPILELHYDNSVKFIDFPVMSEKFIAGMEEEILGVSLSGNLAVKYRDFTRGRDVHSLVSIRLETEKVKTRIMAKILQIKDINFKNGNNGLRVYVTDGIKDYNFLVFSGAIYSFKDFYQEGDVAIIPLKNMGEGCDDPCFRFFDDNSQGTIIERNGVTVCQK